MSHFFALESDIRQLVDQVELKGPLRYTLSAHSRLPECSSLLGGGSIPGLGTADGDQHIVCSSYLVTELPTQIHSHRIDRTDGTIVYAIDQSLNPDSVVMIAGGRWKDGSIIAGRIATCSKSKASERLMRRFRTALRKAFTNIRGNWVGPQALKDLRSGVRLCYAIQSPSLYDLRERITTDDERQIAEYEQEILRRASAEALNVMTAGELVAALSNNARSKKVD